MRRLREKGQVLKYAPALLWVSFWGLSCSDSGPLNLAETRVEEWQDDLSYLKTELPRRHVNLFFQLSQTDFNRQVAEIAASIPLRQDHDIAVAMMQLVASVGDAHTRLDPAPTGLFHVLPMKLYWFEDGLYVTGTLASYQHLLKKRLLRIEGVDIADVLVKIESVIPHENEAQLKNLSPAYLTIPEVLHALQISDSLSAVTLEVEGGGQTEIVATTSIPSFGWVDVMQSVPLPLYMQNLQSNYWYTAVPEQDLFYVQYNVCRDAPGQSFSDFTNEVMARFDAHPAGKFVLDLRLNGGGNSAIARPLIDRLKANPGINRPGRLFVIIGRKTFSSAILNALDLKHETQALFVGEPTGGKPNHYGEVRHFTLPHSEMTVYYSTKYFHHTTDHSPSLLPDIRVELSASDYFSGNDPVLEAILVYQ